MLRRLRFSMLMLGTVAMSLLFSTAPVHAATRPTPLMGATGQSVPRDHAASSCATHAVQTGETLSRIAQHWDTTWPTLYAQNRAIIGPDPNRIRSGMVLQRCDQAPPPAATSGGPAPAGQPCQSTTYWPRGTLSASTTPPGCYATAYRINPTHYPHVSATFGGCDWWPAVLHPTWSIWTRPRHTTPQVGAAILYAPGEQGAGAEGHWGVIVALSADGRFALTSEMNFTIVGRRPHRVDGGWAMVVYRYVKVHPPATVFVY